MNDAYYELRARGSKKDVDGLFAALEDKDGVRGERYCCVRSAKMNVLSEDDGQVLVQVRGAVVPTFCEAAETLYDGLDFSGVAAETSCLIEVFVEGQREDGEDFCEHLLADPDGNMLACEEEDVEGVLDWSNEDIDGPLDEFLEGWGYDPGEYTEADFANGPVYIGGTIDMYEWDGRLVAE